MNFFVKFTKSEIDRARSSYAYFTALDRVRVVGKNEMTALTCVGLFQVYSTIVLTSGPSARSARVDVYIHGSEM